MKPLPRDLSEAWRLHRRDALLSASSAALAPWLTPLAAALARDEEQSPRGAPAQSLIVLWLQGGASQLETFDPHAGQNIAAGTKAIKTSADGVQFADTLPQTAELAHDLAIVRDVVSKEGDHERGVYLGKTGFRPVPTLVHPTLGAIMCHDMQGHAAPEIPAHVSILPNQWPAWGGFLGEQYAAFKTFDPAQKAPNITPRTDAERFARRLKDLEFVNRRFAKGSANSGPGLQVERATAARRMMDSQQMEAFDVSLESSDVRASYGDTAFGRACLAARRLTEVGVRCVEVTLGGWDTHINNHQQQRAACNELDPALAGLLADLRRRERFEHTIVLVATEFGRTPRINAADGRDHWPHGFSLALAGGRLRRGVALGETDPDGNRVPLDGHPTVADVHATILAALGYDPTFENMAPGPRPIKLSEGTPIAKLIEA